MSKNHNVPPSESDAAFVRRMRAIADGDVAAARARPGAMDRIRRAMRTRIGRAAVIVGAPALAVTASLLSGAVNGSHDAHMGHATNPVAAANRVPGRGDNLAAEIASLKGRAAHSELLNEQEQRLQSTAFKVAQRIIQQLGEAPGTIRYADRYVGRFTPTGTSKPEIYASFVDKTVTVESINMPNGQQPKFNDISIAFRLSGKAGRTLTGVASQRPLGVADFENVFSNPGNLSLESISLQTPSGSFANTGERITVNGDGVMIESNGLSSSVITAEDAATTVAPFTDQLSATAGVLNQAFLQNP